jgi:hypothetical protein
MNTRRRLLICFSFLMVVSSLRAQDTAAAGNDFLALFARRVTHSKQNMPDILTAAETSAVRCVTGTNVLINVPYRSQPIFAEELLNRSGGLVNAIATDDRPAEATPNDIVLFSVNSWEADAAKTIPLLNTYRSNHWMVVLFASTSGAPAEAVADYWIDNGASSGANNESDLNVIANAMNSWLWCVEYTAALTRLGKYPGILQGCMEVGADDYDVQLKKAGRAKLYDMQTPIPAYRLSRAYFTAVKKVMQDTGDAETRGQIDKAADILADHLCHSGKVIVATCTHILMADIRRSNLSPWTPLNVVWQTTAGIFENNAGTNDYIVWFGYIGMSTRYEDYGGCIRRTGAKLIASYSVDTYNKSNNTPEPEVLIPQSWGVPDSAVIVPFAPGHMAPVSGIEEALIYRMLDEAVSERLKNVSSVPTP